MNRVIASAALAVAVMAPLALADSVVMRDGRVVENARVLKVGVREVEYNVGKRKVLYVVKKADVAKITYRAGGEDVFPVPEMRKGKRGGPGSYKGEGPGMRRGWRGYDGPPPEGMGPPPPDGPRRGLKPRPIDGVPPPPPPDAPPSESVAPPPPPDAPQPTPQGGPKPK
jgi:hypothetical protein